MILQMMKKSKGMLTVACVIMIMLLAAGCGEKKETPIPVNLSSEGTQDRDGTSEDSSDEDTDEDESRQAKGPAGEGADEDESRQTKGPAGEDENRQAKGPAGEDADKDGQSEDDNSQASQTSGNEELHGDVYSVGQDSFVICKTATSSDGVAVAPAPGHEEADDLVTVYVNQNCAYKYETVKNGGISPEDISSREGSFGDLQEGLVCLVQGSWQDGSFYADSIVMMKFV